MKMFLKISILLGLIASGLIWGSVSEWGRTGLAVSVFIIAVIGSAYFFSGPFVLHVHRAQPLPEDKAPEIYEIVKRLSEKAGIPAPALYFLPSASANACSVGRHSKHAALVITYGIIKLLNREELEGVVGHEIAHIQSREFFIFSAVAGIAGVLSALANSCHRSMSWESGDAETRGRAHPILYLFMIGLSLVSAGWVHFIIPKSREFLADRESARICGNPLYLASALRRIEAAAGRFPLREALAGTAHLFISSPLPKNGWARIFNTHPSIESRILRLGILHTQGHTGDNFRCKPGYRAESIKRC
jgi:heat shock protein HtpX